MGGEVVEVYKGRRKERAILDGDFLRACKVS
jgi:hypothetical protein